MSIRKIELKDLYSVSNVCIDAFMKAVAPNLTEKGINTFKQTACVECIHRRMNADNVMLVYESNGVPIGYAELKEGRHLAMLFVSPDYQNKGVGKSLISEIVTYAKHDAITVSASLNAVSAYEGFGFECSGEASESAGLRYQPMKLKMSQSRGSA